MAGSDTTTEGDRGCELARRSFTCALDQLDPCRLMRARAGEGFQPGAGRTLIVALGKAATGMLTGWLEAVAPEPSSRLAIILVTPRASPALSPAWAARYAAQLTTFTAGHPEPDAQSIAAGEALLAAAGRLGRADDLLVALISGGGSALAAAPTKGGLAELRRLNRELIASGAPIGAVNLIRRYRSRLKGGRLAVAAAPARQQTWILSDMPAEEWQQAASGPTTPDPATAADYAAAVRRWLRREPEAGIEPTPKPGDACFARAVWRKLTDNHDACAALARELRAAGRDPVAIDHASDEMEWAAAAEYLTDRWRRQRARAPRAALLAGGEVRVRLPDDAGMGGRNQQLALAVALALEGEEFTFFSAGTDGVDGNSHAAGACVNGATAGRIRAAGLDPAAHLRRCDATPALAAAHALVETGPTGNNLRDLRMFL